MRAKCADCGNEDTFKIWAPIWDLVIVDSYGDFQYTEESELEHIIPWDNEESVECTKCHDSNIMWIDESGEVFLDSEMEPTKT